MTYNEARLSIKTGDVALVKGLRSIRVATGESYSHVGLFVWIEGPGLWVYEFVEGIGFHALPASQWFRQRAGQIIYWGEAPALVRDNGPMVSAAAVDYRTGRPITRWYGWLSLPVIWLSQVLNQRLPVWLRVCSTYVQECWEAAGYKRLTRTADPGDIAENCQRLTRINN